MIKNNLGKRMLYAGLLAASLGAVNSGHMSAKPVEPAKRLEDITLTDNKEPIAGLVISSNQNAALAYAALEILHANHFEDAFTMKVNVGGKTSYRSVIPYKYDEQVKGIEEAVNDLGYFSDVDDAFKTSLPEGFRLNSSNTKDISQASVAEAIKDSQGWTRQNYIDNFAGRAMNYYNFGREKKLPKAVFESAIGWIFDYATEFNVPVLPTLAVAFQESAMNPTAIGDKNLKGRNTAHGLMQIRIPTIQTVINMMTREGYEDVPANVDAAISSEKDLARLGVYHFAECYARADGNIKGAMACHNQGLNSSFDTSTSYVKKVSQGLSALEDLQDQFQP